MIRLRLRLRLRAVCLVRDDDDGLREALQLVDHGVDSLDHV